MNWDPDQLAALAAAVSEGSFDAAARRLNVTPSAISQRLKALETSVGRVLLVRSRPIVPTTSGVTLLHLARQIEAVLDDAERELDRAGGTVAPSVALAVNADSLATWLPEALAAIDPAVTLDLRRADETRTAELLRDGSVIAAVTAAAEPVPGCTVEPLGRMRYTARASAAFAARWFADGATPANLARAPMVAFDRADELQDRYLRRRSRRRLQPPRHYIPGSGAFVQAVRLGLGWGMVPDLQTVAELVAFDPDGSIDVSLYWQQWRLRSATVERVAVAVRSQAKRSLLAPAQRGRRQAPHRRG